MVDLRSMKAKIDRANKHVRELDDALSDFNTSKPYAIVCEPNDDGSRHEVRLVLTDPDVLDQWSCMIGDFLHNLRCALDYILYAAILAEGSVPEDTEFPIFTSKSKFHRTNARTRAATSWSGLNKIRQVTVPEVRGMIKNAQPYRRDGDPEQHPLALLGFLENADKHASLHPVFLVHRTGQLSLGVHPKGALVHAHLFDTLEDATRPVLLDVSTSPGAHITNVDFEFTMEVAIDVRGVVRNLKEVLDECRFGGGDIRCAHGWGTSGERRCNAHVHSWGASAMIANADR